MTLAHDAASPYQILSGQIFTDILNLRCDLDRSNLIFPQDRSAFDAVLSNKVWLQTNQQFRRHNRNSHIWIILALAVTLTTNTVNQFFYMTHWLIIMHHHTKFGKKWLSGSEDIKQTRSDTQTELLWDRPTEWFQYTPPPPNIYTGRGEGW